MNNQLFTRFSGVIRALPESAVSDLDPRLLIEEAGALQIYYAPFDYINENARVVLVGLTPGLTQMSNAIREARCQLLKNATAEGTLRAAKKTASFSGAMRPNLIALLDSIGLHDWLGVRTCSDLFSGDSQLVQTTSVLRYPVFVNGMNYSGNPDPLGHPFLKRYILNYFAQEAQQLSKAVFVPLGDKAARVLHFLSSSGSIDSDRIFNGLPHPSGANAERIAYFLGQKSRERLSHKTDPEKLDAAKLYLLRKVAGLRSAAV